MSRLGVSLRIARRDARRARGRSALVVAMIALPVLGVGAADVLWRTFELTPAQQITRTMGAADARLQDSGLPALTQDPRGGGFGGEGGPRTGPAADPLSVLPAGSRVVPDRETYGDVVVDGRRTDLQLRELDVTDPLAAGLFTRQAGRLRPGADEAVLTGALADRLGLGLGDQVRLEPRGGTHAVTLTRTVVGLVRSTSNTRVQTALLAPGSLAASPTGLEQGQIGLSYLVDLPRPPVWDDVVRANRAGYYLEGRGPVQGAPVPEDFGSTNQQEVIAVIALIVGMALLEVVLLAGPAFAVGTKRQSRDLALLAASGAERADVRRTVLSGGIVLGAVGGLVGVIAGIGLAALAVPVLVRLNGDLPGPFEVRPLELLLLAAVGVLTAVLAALLPARSASRQDVVAALTGRRGTLRSSRWVPLVGLLAAATGVAIALYGAQHRGITVILVGSALAELGLVATTPTVVGLAGRLGTRLPVTPRLALRDAARNRGRTAPAVAAILAAVAGSVAVGTYVASLDRHDEQRYVPSAPVGSVVLTAFQPGDRERLPAAEAALRQVLPAHRPVALRGFDTNVSGERAPGQDCPAYNDELPRAERARLGRTDPRCGSYQPAQVGAEVLVGGADLVTAVSGARDPAYTRVFAAGGAVVPPLALGADGTAVITVGPPPRPDGTEDEALVRRVRVPAVALPWDALLITVLSEEAAARVGLPVRDLGLIASGPEVTAEQQDRLRAAVRDTGMLDVPMVERGYVSEYGIGLLALVLGSAVIVLGASGIATGLAAADARADLSTLAAVGATPGMRRRLAAFQSAVTAGLGTLLGMAAGLVPAVGLLLALNRPPPGAPAGWARSDPFEIVLPWPNLLVTGLVVPLLAALAAALLTRSRLPMVRRMA